MSKLNWGMKASSVLFLCAAAAIVTRTQTDRISTPVQPFATVHSFDYTDGAYPYAGLAQGTDGNLYGTTFGGGCGKKGQGEGCGTAFKITRSGKLKTLYLFCSQGGNACTDGLLPKAGLVQGADGKFYGTTSNGGAGYGNNDGTVFSITANGKLTTLYSFCLRGGQYCPDGAGPFGGLVEGTDGNFYGTTGRGGANNEDDGTVFKITPSGKLTRLYSFCMSGYPCTDGLGPEAGLVLGTDGKFYGTTVGGGANRNNGTIFSITASGKLTTLHSFDGADGSSPQAALIQGTDGNFYGTTHYGGNPGGGTVFKITPSGTLTVLHNFCSEGGQPCTDGQSPAAGLVQGTDGNFYGTTEYGGLAESPCSYGCGTIFQITPSGELTTLYDFCSQGGSQCTDGLEPQAGLVQDTNGTFYGTAPAGGANYLGLIFSLSMGLGPFVETEPASGKVGAAVNILGTNFLGATGVTFNGTPATFTMFSRTLITTTVPAGATTGIVKVTGPNHDLSSNVPFRVE